MNIRNYKYKLTIIPKLFLCSLKYFSNIDKFGNHTRYTLSYVTNLSDTRPLKISRINLSCVFVYISILQRIVNKVIQIPSSTKLKLKTAYTTVLGK